MNLRALGLAVALMASPAAARADAPPRAVPPPPMVACCDAAPSEWTGLYVGIHAGGAWSDPSWTFPFVESFNTAAGQGFTTSAQGALLGGHLGLNYQLHRYFLIGAEVSWADSRLSDTVTGPVAGSPNDRFTVAMHDLLTVTGRLGVVAGQYLFYAKGGWARADVDINAKSATGTAAQVRIHQDGWTVGGGLEARIISNVLFGLEYDYVSLPGDRYTTVTTGTAPNQPFNADISSLHVHAVVARLSILFGPHACCGEGVLGKW